MEVFFLKTTDPEIFGTTLRKRLKKVTLTGKRIGIKTHFGEEGNKTFIPPVYIKKGVEVLKEKGADVVLIETTTLYRGKRHDALSHINLAYSHGFNPEYVGAPIMILDGFMGEEEWEIEIPDGSVEKAYLAKGLRFLHGIIFFNHFKGHILTGFGGAIKNMSMGCASKKGKMQMHIGTFPYIKESFCTGCGECASYCPTKAIIKTGEIYFIRKELCIGCGGCVSVCKYEAVSLSWGENRKDTMKRMVDYSLAIKKHLWIYHINFLINITPHCDCFPSNGKIMAEDKGILFSEDTISIDKASFDIVQNSLENEYPDIDMLFQLRYGAKRELGTYDYHLKEV